MHQTSIPIVSIADTPNVAVKAKPMPYLHGIRGIAALWVLMFHTQLISGMRQLPLLSYGSLRMELFMILSGFLMAHNYLDRQVKDPWRSPRTWLSFWTRRFFRIAPLYYVVLFVAIVSGPYLGEYRKSLGEKWPTAQTKPERYTDHSISNVVTHVTFVFGAMPDYAYSTPLPDWSLGLEMQFYFVFPFLMLAVAWAGALRTAIIAVAGCLAFENIFPDFVSRFELPSFLPMKLYMFLCGIMLATERVKGTLWRGLLVSLLACLAYGLRDPLTHTASRMAMVAFIYYLLNDGTLPTCSRLETCLNRIKSILGGKVGHFMGEMSYGVYLLHLFILIPTAGILANYDIYAQSSGAARFAMCLGIVIPLVYLLAPVTNKYIERPGVWFGRRVGEYFLASNRYYTGNTQTQESKHPGEG